MTVLVVLPLSFCSVHTISSEFISADALFESSSLYLSHKLFAAQQLCIFWTLCVSVTLHELRSLGRAALALLR